MSFPCAAMASRRFSPLLFLSLTVCVYAAAVTGIPQAPKQRLRTLFAQPQPDRVLVCPRERLPLRKELSIYGATKRETRVSEAGVRYPVTRAYVDLLASSGRSSSQKGLTPNQLADELKELFATRVQTQMFRTPLLSYVYERGWRQNFKNAGFPGIEKEYDEVRQFFQPVADGVVVDMSCGSGLMYRRLVKSGEYGRVIACDYSEAMLRETRRRSIAEGLSAASLELCRCDVAQLPMRDGSVDAMHAGVCLNEEPSSGLDIN